MADVIANAARSGTYRNVPEHDIPEPLRSCYTTQQWMWYFAMNKEQKEERGLPQSQGNTMMLTSPQWDWNPGTLKIDQDPMTHEQNRVSAHQKSIEIDIKIATYNVQSLAKPGKATKISKQCKKNGYHIIGIQESGNTKAGQPSDLNYWRMAAGPQEGKKGDVEIWIAKSFPIATTPDGEKVKIMEHHINVLMAHQRWMIVAIRTPALKIDVMSIHAPVLQRGWPLSIQEGVKF